MVCLQWVYGASAMSLQWVYGASAMSLQWVYGVSAMSLQWVYGVSIVWTGDSMSSSQTLDVFESHM